MRAALISVMTSPLSTKGTGHLGVVNHCLTFILSYYCQHYTVAHTVAQAVKVILGPSDQVKCNTKPSHQSLEFLDFHEIQSHFDAIN